MYDNMAVVWVVASGGSRDAYLSACLRNIWLICGHYDIELRVEQVKGNDNIIANVLSRIYSTNPINLPFVNVLKNTKIWENIRPQYFAIELGF